VACSVIRENLKVWGWMEKAQVWKSAVKPSLRRLGEGGENFDIVFADPPFTREEELRDLATGLDNWCSCCIMRGSVLTACSLCSTTGRQCRRFRLRGRRCSRAARVSRCCRFTPYAVSFYQLKS
jgi:hypothetical protein